MTREEAIKLLSNERCGWCVFFNEEEQKCLKGNGCYEATMMAVQALQEPEIVHCKDCKYWIGTGEIKQCSLAGYLIGERGYCLYGVKGVSRNDRISY